MQTEIWFECLVCLICSSFIVIIWFIIVLRALLQEFLFRVFGLFVLFFVYYCYLIYYCLQALLQEFLLFPREAGVIANMLSTCWVFSTPYLTMSWQHVQHLQVSVLVTLHTTKIRQPDWLSNTHRWCASFCPVLFPLGLLRFVVFFPLWFRLL